MRYIGIRHRVKVTAEGEARPTQIAITDQEGKPIADYKLETETDELDFVLGRFPVTWRPVNAEEDISGFLPRHCKWRKIEKEENTADIPPHHLRKGKGKKGITEVVTKVPSTYDGLKDGDIIAMTLGGSGDRFAFALSRQCTDEFENAIVLRIPPFILKERRGDLTKDSDHITLATLVRTMKHLFYPVEIREREYIRMREAVRGRRFAQLDRIACGQRLVDRHKGEIFLSSDGKYPEGLIEDEYDEVLANDEIFQNHVFKEKQRTRELRAIVQETDLWKKLFEPIEGCGEVLASEIMAPIGNVTRFKRKEQLKAFCGVHVMLDGRFPRARRKKKRNEEIYSPEEEVLTKKEIDESLDGTLPKQSGNTEPQYNRLARQALYNLGDQFVYRPNSHWGQVLRMYKAKFRKKHPEPLTVNKKKRYTDGHIHKMAFWRTLTKFVEWLHKEWTAIEVQRKSVTQ